MSDEEEQEIFGYDDESSDEKRFSEDDFEVGYDQIQQIQYEDESGVLQAGVAGGKAGDIQRKLALMHMQPEERFRKELEDLFRESVFPIANDDKALLRQIVSDLPFVRFRSAVGYIAGFLLYARGASNWEAVEEALRGQDLALGDVVKYARWFKTHLKPASAAK